MNIKKTLLALVGAAASTFSAWAIPTVSITKVQQDYPWSNVVGVDYAVTLPDGENAADYELKFYATVNNAVSEVTVTDKDGKNLLAAGSHTAYWTPEANLKDTEASLAAKVVDKSGKSTPETVGELYVVVTNNAQYAEDTYVKKSDAESTYAKGSNFGVTAGTGTSTLNINGSSAVVLTAHQDLSAYQKTADAASTYLSKTDAASTYQPKGNYQAAGSYVTTTAAESTYAKSANFGVTAGSGTTTLKINGTSATVLTAHQSLSDYAKTADVTTAIANATNGLASSNASATYSGQNYMIVDLATGAVVYENGAPESYNNDIYKTTKMVFRRVPAGTYSVTTGKTYSATAASGTLAPNANATMAKDYFIAIFECTVAQYNRIMNSGAFTDKNPKASITWNAIRDSALPTNNVPNTGAGVIAKLNTKVQGKMGSSYYFDLPNETMWQIAAQADGHPGDYRFYGNDEYRLNRYANRKGSVQNVGLLLPNQWGIYDIYGNVWEWCRDACGYVAWNNGVQNGAEDQSLTQTPQNEGAGASRVIRGGTCGSDDAAAWSRSGSRSRAVGPTYSSASIGFRLSRIVQ